MSQNELIILTYAKKPLNNLTGLFEGFLHEEMCCKDVSIVVRMPGNR